MSNIKLRWLLFLLCISLDLCVINNGIAVSFGDGDKDARLVEQNCLFELTAPRGWSWDKHSSNILSTTVFFRRTKNKTEDNLNISVSTIDWPNGIPTSTDSVVDNQNQLMKAKDSTVSMKQLKSIQLEEGKEAIVRTFISSKGYYAIAYLACEKGVVKFNLFSKRKKSFEESIKALIELVKSYEKIDKSVIIRD